MDVTTTDQRAWALAPLLVVSAPADGDGGPVEWLNPATGTRCRLDAEGEYVVLRRGTPVVAGRILLDQAEALLTAPETVPARRAAAQAIVAVDGAGTA